MYEGDFSFQKKKNAMACWCGVSTVPRDPLESVSLTFHTPAVVFLRGLGHGVNAVMFQGDGNDWVNQDRIIFHGEVCLSMNIKSKIRSMSLEID